MGRAADFSGLQFKTLNKSKGRSVWSPRAQTDKRVYERYVSNEILQNEKIEVVVGEVVGEETTIQRRGFWTKIWPAENPPWASEKFVWPQKHSSVLQKDSSGPQKKIWD